MIRNGQVVERLEILDDLMGAGRRRAITFHKQRRSLD